MPVALNKLPIAAPEKHHDTCLEGTRTEILREIRQWANNPKSPPIFALIDQAGTGKSTIANTMIQEWLGERRLGARFYFTKPSIVKATKLASSLSRGLADRALHIRHHIAAAVARHLDFVNDRIPDQLDLLVFQPLKNGKGTLSEALEAIRAEKISKSGIKSIEKALRYIGDSEVVKNAEKEYLCRLESLRMGQPGEGRKTTLEEASMRYLDAVETELVKLFEEPLIIVIDALDECSEERLLVLNSFLGTATSPPTYKLLLTCRPENDIYSKIQENAQVICRPTDSLLAETNHPSRDISIYASMHLKNVLNDFQVSQFVIRAGGLFVWASTARRFLEGAKNDPTRVMMRFKKLMVPNSRESAMKDLYYDILESAIPEDAEEVKVLKRLLQVVATSREPMTIQAINEVLSLSDSSQGSIVGGLVADLRSVLSYGSSDNAVYPLHPTFVEYLQSDQKPDQLQFPFDEAELFLALNCLRSLNTGLQYDILGISCRDDLTPPNSDIKDLQERIQVRTTPLLRYAAVHGLSHVIYSFSHSSVVSQMRSFIREKPLYWIEIMSLLGKTYILTQTVHALKARIQDIMGGAKGSLGEGESKSIEQPPVSLVSDRFTLQAQLIGYRHRKI